MGKIDGFLQFDRAIESNQPIQERLSHFNEFSVQEQKTHVENQSARCMDCGVPFCHNGCPLGNKIPEFNDLVYQNEWKLAYEVLISTNNFPEFTGRICPAPCEGSCVLGINSDPVAIEYIEKSIIEIAFENQWVKPNLPKNESDQKIAIIGSGPAGLACADQLRGEGHSITVFERADRIGGLLRYGIPNFKLEKSVLDRRIELLKEAGIEFKTNHNIGVEIDPQKLLDEYNAVVLCIGSTVPRDLKIEGRELNGIYFAMDFLTKVTQQIAGDTIDVIDCKDKNILVIGGGDTGSDCIGSANRLGAKSIKQFELLSKPPNQRSSDNPWPKWPMILRTSSSHEEGSEREWCILTKKFISKDGIHLSGVETVKVNWEKDEDGQYQMIEIPDSAQIIECDIVFLAIGFIHPQLEDLFSKLDISLDSSKNIKTTQYQTSVQKLFAAGDARMGQSLVVHAIAEGRKVAASVHHYLQKNETIRQKVYASNPFAL